MVDSSSHGSPTHFPGGCDTSAKPEGAEAVHAAAFVVKRALKNASKKGHFSWGNHGKPIEF